MRFCVINTKATLQHVLILLFCIMCLKIILFRLLPHHLRANELIIVHPYQCKSSQHPLCVCTYVASIHYENNATGCFHLHHIRHYPAKLVHHHYQNNHRTRLHPQWIPIAFMLPEHQPAPTCNIHNHKIKNVVNLSISMLVRPLQMVNIHSMIS